MYSNSLFSSKKPFFLMVLLLTLFLAMFAPSLSQAADKNTLLQRFTAIGTGSVSGTYFPLGIGLARLLNGSSPEDVFFVVPTDGSLENIHLVTRGDVKYGFCQSDIFTFALKGEKMFTEGPNKKLQAVLSLYPETIQVIVRGDSNIWTIDDLRGKKLIMGGELSGTRHNAEMILKSHKISVSEVTPVYLDFSQGLEVLEDKNVDAVFVTAGFPTEAVAELAHRTSIRLLSLEQTQVTEICKEHSYFAQSVIPGKTYQGQESDVLTLATRALLITRSDTSKKEVTRLVEQIFAGTTFLGNIHQMGLHITRSDALTGIYPQYLHEGVRYLLPEELQTNKRK